MISPGRVSDDVFDLMDLFGTSLRLAGISQDVLPGDRYYDFIDQSSFLFHSEGMSNRESVYFWWGTELMGITNERIQGTHQSDYSSSTSYVD